MIIEQRLMAHHIKSSYNTLQMAMTSWRPSEFSSMDVLMGK